MKRTGIKKTAAIILTMALFCMASPAYANTSEPLTRLKNIPHDAGPEFLTPGLSAVYESDWFPTSEEIKTELGMDVRDQMDGLVSSFANSSNPYDLFKLGIAYEIIGDFQKAINTLEKTIKLVPDQKEVYQELAALYQEQKPGIISVFINGSKINFKDGNDEVNPTIVNGRTLVPIRKLSEALGGTVAWKGETLTADIRLSDTSISLVQDSTNATVNGVPVTLEVPAQNIGGHILVPLRFISEHFNKSVEYIPGDNGTAIIPIVDTTSVTVSANENGSGLNDNGYDQIVTLQQKEKDLYVKMKTQNDRNISAFKILYDQISNADFVLMKSVHDQNQALRDANKSLYNQSLLEDQIKANNASIKDVVSRVEEARNHIRSTLDPIKPLMKQITTLWSMERSYENRRISEWKQLDDAVFIGDPNGANEALKQLHAEKQQIYNIRVEIYRLMQLVGAKLPQNSISGPLSGNSTAPYSNTDTQAPIAPANLTAIAVSSSQINLNWTASTDNVGVTGYDIYRDGVLIGSSVSTSYGEIGMTASTAYSYTVKAKDAAGNVSAPSNTASVSTQASVDTHVPTAPANLTAIAASNSLVNLYWTASTDDVGVTGYDLYRNGIKTATVTSTTYYSDMGLAASTVYSYFVKAKNAAGNGSASSNTASTLTEPGIRTYTILNPSGWTASSNPTSGDVPANMLNGRLSDRWSTGGGQAAGQYLIMDMTAAHNFNRIVMDSMNASNDYARSYEVYVSNDGTTWGSPVANGSGIDAVVTADFAPQNARYIKVMLTASAPSWWSINEFRVYDSAAAAKSTLSRTGWTADSSPLTAVALPFNMLDGNSSTRWSTNTPQAPGQNFTVDMQLIRRFNRIIMDSNFGSDNDYARNYEVYVSVDGTNWGAPIASGTGSGMTIVDFSPQTARYIKVVLTGSAASWWSVHEFNVYD